MMAMERKMLNMPRLPTFFLMAGTMGMKMKAGKGPRPMKMAFSMALFTSSAKRMATMMGMPACTARPPRLAMNMRTEVRMVISLVSRVSELFSAP